MNDIQINLQNEIFNKYYKLFYLITFGCGGVIFRQHLIKFLGKSNKTCNDIIKQMEEVKLIRHYKLGRNTIGRSASCDIQLAEASVSDLHASISVKIMKSTGMVRKVDELGRIVLPIELRKTFNT